VALKASKKFYFCGQCKDQIIDIGEAIFAEDFYMRPFCSDTCLAEFHTPYINFFEIEEEKHRFSLDHFETQEVDKLRGDERVIKLTLENPEEVLIETNELEEEFYTLVKKVNLNEISGDESIADSKSYFSIIICFKFDQSASVVLFHTLSSNINMVNFYRIGRNCNDDYSFDEEEEEEAESEIQEYPINKEILENVELKKSEFLSHLLGIRDEEDISFAEFHLYDDYIPMVLEDPDEVYERTDDEDDIILTYVKSFQGEDLTEGKAFYYVVICLKLGEDEDKNEDVLIPIICFPSLDSKLYIKYKMGDKISGGLKN
jgi:hypothetical protein